jgi:hypothetical protein
VNGFTTDLCGSFVAHWQSLRVGGALPRLQDFLSAPHPVLQPNVAIKDIIPPRVLRIRLFGTGLADVAGVDVTGRNVIDIAATETMAEQLWTLQDAAARHPVGLASTKLCATVSGRNIAVEDVELPLTPFPGGPPCLVCYVAQIETADYQHRTFKLLSYTTARWIDIGWGVPSSPPLVSAAAC